MDIEGLLHQIVEKELDRRGFFRWVIRASVAVTALGLMGQVDCGTEALPLYPGSPFMQPQTDDEKTVYAVCEAILPGTASDPSGAPGANDVGTMNVVYDKFYPAVQYLPPVIALINSAAWSKYNKKFYDLDMPGRTDVLAGIEGSLQIIDLLYEYMKAPFYVGILSDAGLRYMGFPGPNLGYRDEDFSFFKPMSREMTPNGNRP